MSEPLLTILKLVPASRCSTSSSSACCGPCGPRSHRPARRAGGARRRRRRAAGAGAPHGRARRQGRRRASWSSSPPTARASAYDARPTSSPSAGPPAARSPSTTPTCRQLHARVFRATAQLLRRGPRLHQRHLPQPQEGRRRRWRCKRGDRLQVGNTVLEVDAVTRAPLAARPPTSGRVRAQINEDALLVDRARSSPWPTAWAATRRRGRVADRRRGAASRLRRADRRRASSRRCAAPTSAVVDRAERRPRPAGHGHHAHRRRPGRATTASEQLAVVNVGDSRVYLLRDGELEPAHRGPQPGRGAGARGPAHRRRRRRSTRSATSSPGPSASSPTSRSTPGRSSRTRGDRYLLCSDGLFNEVDDDRIAGDAAPARRPRRGGQRAGAPGQRERRPRQHHRRRRRRRRRRRPGRARPRPPLGRRRRRRAGRPPAPARRPVDADEPAPRRAAAARRRREPTRRATPRAAAPASPGASSLFVARRRSLVLGGARRRRRLVRPRTPTTSAFDGDAGRHLPGPARRRAVVRPDARASAPTSPSTTCRPARRRRRARPASEVPSLDDARALRAQPRGRGHASPPRATTTTTTTTHHDRPPPPTTTPAASPTAVDAVIDARPPQHRARPDRPRPRSSPAAPTRWPASGRTADAPGQHRARSSASCSACSASPTSPPAGWRPSADGDAAAARRPAQRHRLRLHRPPRRRPRRPAGHVDRGRHRRLRRSRWSSCAGPATSSATATRSLLVGVGLLLLPAACPGIGRNINGARIWVQHRPASASSPASSPRSSSPSSSPSYLVEKRELLGRRVARRIGPLRLPDLAAPRARARWRGASRSW